MVLKKDDYEKKGRSTEVVGSKQADDTLFRLYIDTLNPDGERALKLLRNAELRTVTFPRDGTKPPELRVGRHSYVGISAITAEVFRHTHPA